MGADRDEKQDEENIFGSLDTLDPQNAAKIAAAKTALMFVRSGMRVGLGSGSTSDIFVRLLGQAVRKGELTDITAIATSPGIDHLARSTGIATIPFEQVNDEGFHLDIAVDGADEVEPRTLALTKGWGKAHTREKLVEHTAVRLVIIVDDSKLVDRLGTKEYKGESTVIPVELAPEEYPAALETLTAAITGAQVTPWMDAGTGEPIWTPDGNLLIRLHVEGGLTDPQATAQAIENVQGVVDHGLFLDMATTVIVAGKEGIRVLGEQIDDING